MTAPFDTLPSGIEIARYFWEETSHRNDRYNGIDLWRNGMNYCYLWVEATTDQDMWMSFLLDIRAKVGPGVETRDYLFLRAGFGEVSDVEWYNQPISFGASTEEHIDRLDRGLDWFRRLTIGSIREED